MKKFMITVISVVTVLVSVVFAQEWRPVVINENGEANSQASADSQNDIQLPVPIKNRTSIIGYSSEKFDGGYVKRGDDIYRISEESERKGYLDGRDYPPKSIEMRKKEAQEGVAYYQKWYDRVTCNGNLNMSCFKAVSYNSIEIDRANFKIFAIRAKNFEEAKDCRDDIKYISEQELVNFEGFVRFHIRIRTNQGSYGMEVFVNNAFMRYHINERSGRIDQITFPKYTTGAVLNGQNKRFLIYSAQTDKYFDSSFYADERPGYFQGEYIGYFRYDPLGSFYHDHSEAERRFYRGY